MLSAVRAALGLLLWMSLSAWIIVSNKELIKSHNFQHPMTLSALGMFASSSLAFVARCGVTVVARLRGVKVAASGWLKTEWRQVVPLGFIGALTLYTGNAAYLTLNLGFVQMLKAFTPVVTLVLLWLFDLDTVTPKLGVATSLIAAGTAMAANAEPRLDLTGLAYMFTSMLGEALRMVLTQRMLTKSPKVKRERELAPWTDTLRYLDTLGTTALVTTVFLVVGAHHVERDGMYDALPRLFVAMPFYTAGKASLAFFVNLSQIAAMGACGSLVLKVAGCVKSALLVYLGRLFFNEPVTAQGMCGYGISLVGFYLFQREKRRTAEIVSVPRAMNGSAKVATSPVRRSARLKKA